MIKKLVACSLLDHALRSWICKACGLSLKYSNARKWFITVETGRTRLHYDFYAAMKVEYDIIHADVTYEREIQLGEDPIRLDFLIVNQDASVVLNDPIGEFFNAINLFEYKPHEDRPPINDFYKAQGYGLIYKVFDRNVNELPIEKMTLTLIRHSYSRELINALR